jgi:membrane dipeptidase
VARAAAATLAGPLVSWPPQRASARTSRHYAERVTRLVRESLVVDLLNQFLYRNDRQSLLQQWLSQSGAFKRADFDLFASSGVNAINFGQLASSLQDALALLDAWNGFLARYPRWLTNIRAAKDLLAAKADGRYGILFGLQSSAQFESLDAVDACYAHGLRISQLTHNFRSPIADGDFEAHDAGVSEYGATVIERMNALGMAVDLAHASDRTQLQACEISKSALIVSHGNCRALNPGSMRATTDDAIRAIARKGGVIGIAFVTFMVKGSDPVTIEDVVDHFDHVRDLVGIEHVGMGSDSGIESNDLGSPRMLRETLARIDPHYHVHGARELVAGLEGPNRVYEITAALARRGYTDEHIRLVLGENWRRVLGEIWRG